MSGETRPMTDEIRIRNALYNGLPGLSVNWLNVELTGPQRVRIAHMAARAIKPTDAERALVEWMVAPYASPDGSLLSCQWCDGWWTPGEDEMHDCDCLVAAVLRERKDAADG